MAPLARRVAPRRLPLIFVEKERFWAADANKGLAPLGPTETARERLRKLFVDHGGLYLLDLDGQAAGAPNLELYQALERFRVFPWVDAGFRKSEDVMDTLFAGAESVTLQPRHMSDADLVDAAALCEADLYLGFNVEERGLERRLRPHDVIELAQRLEATGVVLYETPASNFHDAENAGFEILRAGLPAAWVAQPRSPHTARALASDRFAIVAVPEASPG